MSRYEPDCGLLVRPGAGATSAAPPVLRHLSAAGRLDGLLFELDVRQTYRNEGDETLEVIYTFPLPFDAVLLGLQVELGGVRRAGVVAEQRMAERRYEDAMAAGDTPILLERAGDGLYTVSLGNLKPGEEAVVEYRYGQLLSFAQGQVRLCLPTTIAPRYGQAQRQDGLRAHQVPSASLEADYTLVLAIDVRGAMARGAIGCASHAVTMRPIDGGVHLALGPGARLDRDVVFTLATPTLGSAAQSVADGEEHVVMVSMQPAAMASQGEGIVLKLLVDCSGSMNGDSIASARVALQHVARRLQETDRVSYSRFGSDVRHDFRRLAPARGDALKVLEKAIAATDADLGGTELTAALRSTFELASGTDRADVLLITDGEIWGVEDLIASARASGHRVFAVGVGSAPAEPVLRRLAEATGGACEFATPGENLHAAIDRMFVRIRQGAHGSLRLAWGEGSAQPLWISPLPRALFGGDTLHVFAGFASTVPERVRLLGAAGDGELRALAEATIEPCGAGSDTLPRMAASARLPACQRQEALALALQYQLITDQTHCLVIHERAQADKVTAFAHLHAVPQMLAAGWGGMGRLGSPIAASHDYAAMALSCSDEDMFFGHTPAGMAPETDQRLQDTVRHSMLDRGLEALADPSGMPFDAVLDAADAIDEGRRCVEPLMLLGHTRKTAWALWVCWQLREEQRMPGPAARQALDLCLAHVDGVKVAEAMDLLDRLQPSGEAVEEPAERSVWKRLFRRAAA